LAHRLVSTSPLMLVVRKSLVRQSPVALPSDA
jgi:hypothetical protein